MGVEFPCPRCTAPLQHSIPGEIVSCPRCHQEIIAPSQRFHVAPGVPVHTIRCYDCGKRVPETGSVRRIVQTGSRCVSGSSWGNNWADRRSYGATESIYEKVDLCPECNDKRTREAAAQARRAVVAGLLAILGVVAFAWWVAVSGGIKPNAGTKIPNSTALEPQPKEEKEGKKAIAPQGEEAKQTDEPAPEKQPPPSPEELAKQQAAKEKAQAELNETNGARKLGLAKAQLADGRRNLGNKSGEKLIEFAILRLEAIIADFPGTAAAAEAQQVLKDARFFLEDWRKGR